MIQTKIIPGLVGCAASYAIGYSYGKWAHVPPHLTGSVLAISHLAYRLLKSLCEWKRDTLIDLPLNNPLRKFWPKAEIHRFHKNVLICLTALIQMVVLTKLNLFRQGKSDIIPFCILPGVQLLLLYNPRTAKIV